MRASDVFTNQQMGASPSLLQSFGNWVKQNHAQQPFLQAEARSWVREGREDFLNVILKAFPDSMSLGREMGSPGSPTPQQTTSSLTGRPLTLDR